MVEVVITKEAASNFQNLGPRDQQKIRKRLQYLEQDVYAGKKLTGKLSNIYSLRAWPYRIFYLFHKNQVWITHIEHRQSAYRK